MKLTRTLRFGDSGEDVGYVQQFLKDLGYYTGPIDNSFGPGTGFQKAVVAFQVAENLENPNGNIGPITRARIIEMMIEAPKPVPEPPKAPVEDPKIKELQLKVAQLEMWIDRAKEHAKQIYEG